MSKKTARIFIFFALFIVITVTLTTVLNFKSNHEWVSLKEDQVPAAVLDTLSKQHANKLMDFVPLLDTSFYKKMTFNIVNHHFVVGAYDYYEIEYKGNELIVKKEFLDPPFVVYQNKMYAIKRQKLSADSSKPFDFVYTVLEK